MIPPNTAVLSALALPRKEKLRPGRALPLRESHLSPSLFAWEHLGQRSGRQQPWNVPAWHNQASCGGKGATPGETQAGSHVCWREVAAWAWTTKAIVRMPCRPPYPVKGSH